MDNNHESKLEEAGPEFPKVKAGIKAGPDIEIVPSPITKPNTDPK